MKKNALALALMAATLGLVGCIGDDKDQDTQALNDAYVGFEPVIASADNAGLPDSQKRGPVIPFPFDGLFGDLTKPTLQIPNPSNNPLVTQANLQDGFSTTASWFVDVFGFVDMSTVPSHIVIINRSTGQLLKYNEDFVVQSSTVKDSAGVPINLQRTRLLIEPLKPLAPNTTYIVALTKGIKTTNGGTVQPSYVFRLLNSDTPISARSDSYLQRFNAAEKANLESLRSQLVRPITQALDGLGIKEVVLAYSVTTQSTTKTLDKLAATTVAGAINAQATGLTVQNLLPVTVPNANNTDVYVGTLTVPYYGEVPSVAKPTAILSTYWKADTTQPDVSAKFLDKVVCGAYATGAALPAGTAQASISTTTCFPMPVKQSDQTIPMLVTVPKGAKPDGGWPVVIFQHGITGNRSNVLPIAPALAQAGFVTVAIDLPLHGITPNDVAKALRMTGVSERTFDVDFVNNTTSAAGADGNVDSSGTHFINLSSPITSRENLRQGAADILVLAKSLANLNLDGVAGGDINTNRVQLASISLGSIVSTVALGADKAKTIGAASLSVGGSGIAKLLDASKSFGPRIAAGLATNGVTEGTDNYETFLRFAQTLVDSGDPANFAVSAKANHTIHLTEVTDDLVVPNQALAGAASATQDTVSLTGFLSGTEPLAKILGFSTPQAVDVTSLTKANLTGGAWVKFKQGAHSSLLDTTANPPVTVEMQCQTAGFFATNGAVVPVGCSLPTAE
ncbi:virulence factor lipase-like protein [Agitococcus lubricus]|uniref:Virulence factor lipase-like protein n=2 Tax=Agitococcus lubricus TaxID=1077255 RepID=A0A2T5J2W2_9GAMM|nr:virulence factor lipase-like protein [Agitococcus lubricus]